MNETRNASRRLKGLGRFCIIAAAIFLFFSVISPRIVSRSPAMQRFGMVQDVLGIHSGLMYYTDLKTQQETQDTVRYALEQASR